MFTNFSLWLVRISYKSTYAVLIVLLCLVTGGWFLTANLSMNMQWAALLAPQNGGVKEFNAVNANFGCVGDVTLLLSGQTDEILSAAAAIQETLQGKPQLVRSVSYRLDEDYLNKHGLLLQSTESLLSLRDYFQDLSLIPMISRINGELTIANAQQNRIKRETDLARLMGFTSALLHAYQGYLSTSSGLGSQSIDNFIKHTLIGRAEFLSNNHESLLILVQPVGDSVEPILRLTHNALKQYPMVQLSYAGPTVLDYEQYRSVFDHLHASFWIICLLIGLIVIVAFRLILAPIILLVPAATALLWTVVIIAHTTGEFNLITAFSSAILFVLSINYTIIFMSRYTSDGAVDYSIPHRLVYAIHHSWGGLITGATVAGFFFIVFLASPLPALQLLALNLAVGISVNILLLLFFVPALLVWAQKVSLPLLDHEKNIHQLLYWEPKILHRLIHNSRQSNWLILGLCAVLTILMITQIPAIQIDQRRFSLLPATLPAMSGLAEVGKQFQFTPLPAVCAVARIEDLRNYSARFNMLPEVARVDSLANYFPGPGEQKERLAIIQELHQVLRLPRPLPAINEHNIRNELDKLASNLAEIGGKSSSLRLVSFAAEINDQQIEEIQTRLAEPRAIVRTSAFQALLVARLRNTLLELTKVSIITAEDIPAELKHRYIGKDGKYLMAIYPRYETMSRVEQNNFYYQTTRVYSRISSEERLRLAVLKSGINSVQGLFPIAGLLGLALLWIIYRQFIPAVLALLPVIVGLSWLIGGMSYLHLPLNAFSILALPLIIAVGIHYGCHLITGWLNSCHEPTPLWSIQPIMLSALVMQTGAAVLATGLNPGLASFGLVLFLGVGYCFLAAVLILPACFALLNE